MQPYDCRDLILCLDEVSEGFQVSELILGEIEGDRDFQFRKIRLKSIVIPFMPLNSRVVIRQRHESDILFKFKATSASIDQSSNLMDILGEERIEVGTSPELADESF